MNNRWRVFPIAAVLILLWGTIAAGPFRVFSEMVRDTAAAAASSVGLSGFTLAVAVHLTATVLMAALFLAGRTRHDELVAGICVLAATVYHMIGRITDQTFTSTSTALLIGLSAVLACLAFRLRTATLWLGDAFAASIAVMLLYDAVILPAMVWFAVPAGWLPGWLKIGTLSLSGSAVSHAGLPGWLAGVILAAVSAGALFAFSRRRGGSKG